VVIWGTGSIHRFPYFNHLFSHAELMPSTFGSGGLIFQHKIDKKETNTCDLRCKVVSAHVLVPDWIMTCILTLQIELERDDIDSRLLLIC
jgi:hypothetical protein